MKITRFQYNIDYIHIITFREEYKLAVSPYFGFDKLRYAIDNENTIHESIRLIFPIEHMAFFIRKEGLTFLFEGSIMHRDTLGTEVEIKPGAVNWAPRVAL